MNTRLHFYTLDSSSSLATFSHEKMFLRLCATLNYQMRGCNCNCCKFLHPKSSIPFRKYFQKQSSGGVLEKRPATLLKKELWHRCFPVNFVKFLRTPFFTELLPWLFLYCSKLEFHKAVRDKIFFLYQFNNTYTIC